MNFADLPMVTNALPMVTDARPLGANALPNPNLPREEDCRFRTRQLEGELLVQSKLTAELEQSNAQLLQQLFQANQTRLQLQQRCTYLYDMVRAQLKEKKGNNAEITLLRGQLHELRGQHQRVLAERLVPVARLPHGPGPVSKPARPLQMVRLPDPAAWVNLYGGSMTADGLDEIPRNPSFQGFGFPERQRPPLSRCQSSDLSPEEKEEIKTRMLTDRGPSRRPSSSEAPPSPNDNANRESETQALPKQVTAGFSRGMKVDPDARSPGVDGGSLLSHHGNDARQGEPVSSPLQDEDCSVRLRGSKGWRADVSREMKKEEAGVGRSDEKPAPSAEGPSAASLDFEVGDQEHGEQRQGHDCEATGKVCAGEAARATTPPAPMLPTDIETLLGRTASDSMDVASAHGATPSSGSPPDSAGPHGPEHDGRKPTACQPIVQQARPVALGSPTSGPPVASCSPTLGGAAEGYQGASAENPGVFAPSPASVAEPESMEVVAPPASTDASVSSEQSDVSSVTPSSVSLSSASGFRRNTGRHFPYEAPLDSPTQIDGVLGRPANKITVKSERLSESAWTPTANDKQAKAEICDDTVKDGRAPLEPDHALDRYQYTTFCSACCEPRVRRQAVALCQLCPRMFCGLCAAGLGQSVSPVEGDSDVLLPGEKCVCLRRDSEFPKPPKGVRPEAHLLEHLFAHDLSLQFREEVAVYDNPGYLGVITRGEMMDLGTMRKNMQRNRYDTARGQGKFRSDVKQIWLNCWKFAGCSPESTAPVPGIVSCARILDRMVGKFCDAYMEGPEELVSVGLNVPEIPRLADDGFEDSDEETESEPEPEIVDMEPPAASIAGRKRKAVDDAPSVAGMEISEDTGQSHGGSASPAKEQSADNLCSLAGIGEKLLRAGSS